MFLLDPLTRPSPFWMRKWIDSKLSTHLCAFFRRQGFADQSSPSLQSDAPAQEGFAHTSIRLFHYLELLWWFFFCIAINPTRWKWALFVMAGIGMGLPEETTEAEDVVREQLGFAGKAEKKDVGGSL
jgi:hypothetical protein